MATLIETFQCFTGTLVVCPKCGELLRLTDLTFSFAGKIDGTIVDTIREKERLLQRQDALLNKQRERFDAKWKAVREAAVQRGRKKAKSLVRKLDSAISDLRFDPNDIKAIAYPVDLVVFDGLSEGERIKKIVFIGRSHSRVKFRSLHRRINQVLMKGWVTWETVRILVDGTIEVTTK